MAARWRFVAAMFPADIQHDVPLAPLTTFEVGGPARHLLRITDPSGLSAALTWARQQQQPALILGGGSNVVVSDAGWPGLVVYLAPHDDASQLVYAATADANAVHVDVPATLRWETLVGAAAAAGLWGLSCLAGIPGLVGAAPVQNIGAYGASLADVLVSVDVVDRADGARQRLAAADLGLGYRHSHFKGHWRERYVIVGLRLRLCLTPKPPMRLAYPALVEALGLTVGAGLGQVSPGDVLEAVLGLRRAKSMVWDLKDANHRSAGSFFTNPVVTTQKGQQLQARHKDMPVWYGPHGAKLSAAWLIEHAGFARGWRQGRAGLSTRHTLALINCGGATALELIAAAVSLRTGVHRTFGVHLTPEPALYGFAEAELAALRQTLA
jgi:UDP-N-acetylmuramate dehydrogenase